ncbi:MAG: S-layer family protein [Oscillatoria sp. SIO1A7]|nr:S-layer family protein [Oscillatoria sp. SIO1A7]
MTLNKGRGIKLAQSSALLLLIWCVSNRPGAAQIAADTTLGSNNSIVNQNGNNFTVDGGATSGSSLFHSFQEFSVPNGSEVLFNNVQTIENIITRVTGGTISEINGQISANGSANLFLLNPAGVVFGENASLNIGGSFLASTADSFQLSDGSFYSATNPEAPPLLTVNIPTGLQYGSNRGAIVNRSLVPGADPANPGSTTRAGLTVQPGRTLALVGGDTRLEGGNLSVPSGRVELGGVGDNGFVGLSPVDNGFALSYDAVENFRDVELSGGALLNATGQRSSEIQIRAQNFRILPGARIYARNLGDQAGGNILINASEQVEAIGTGNYVVDTVVFSDSNFSNPLGLPTGLFAVSSGTGAGGSIEIDSRQVSARDSAFIAAATSGAGRGGDLTINASESVQASAGRIESGTTLESLGDSGNLTVNTGSLILQEVGILFATTSGAGRAGDLVINASNSIELTGTDLLFAQRSDGLPIVLNSALFASTSGSGDAGEMRLSTPRLILRDGASIAPNSSGPGRPGNAIITASDIELIGTSPPGAFAFPASIFPSAIDPSATTEGGNATIVTENLTVRDGAVIVAQNAAVGGGGSVEVVAETILLDNAGIIVATAFGQGGNIRLQARDIILRGNSNFSATAGDVSSPAGLLPPEAVAFFAPLVSGVGNGGNITIETDNLVALENSDIVANAQEGVGGRVSITARGIFGTQFREELTPMSDITATSALGPQFNGIVEINTPNEPVSPERLPQQTIGQSDRILTGCAAEQGNSFIVTGRGGLPEDPASGLLGRPLWWDSRNPLPIAREATNDRIAETESIPSAASSSNNSSEAPGYSAPIVEATGWQMNSRGEVELVAHVPTGAPWYKPARCQDVGQEGIVSRD